jgi:lipopolysaccharide transport protein LptA
MSDGAITDLLINRDYVMAKRTTVALVILALYAGLNDAADMPRLSDNDTIIIAADESWEEADQGTIYFRGDVEIQTPGWAIMADRVIVYGKLEAVERIVADGSPVKFIYSNPTAANNTFADGEGLHLEFLHDAALLTLSGNAILTGEGRIMQSSEIQYDLEQRELMAGGTEGVHITITPVGNAVPDPGQPQQN